MDEQANLNQAWAALRVVLKDAFTFYEIKDISGLAGIDVTRFASLIQRAGGGASKGQLITALDKEISELDQEPKSRVLTRFAEEIARSHPDQIKRLDEYLGHLGWQFEAGRLIPVELLDIADLTELPDLVRTDLAKATVRLRDGDLGGALAAACAAVDSATNSVLSEHGQSARSTTGFQERCSKAMQEKILSRKYMTNLSRWDGKKLKPVNLRTTFAVR